MIKGSQGIVKLEKIFNSVLFLKYRLIICKIIEAKLCLTLNYLYKLSHCN